MADDFKKASCKECGPGGLKCPCCGPKPGKERKKLRRRIRRRLKRTTRKEAEREKEDK